MEPIQYLRALRQWWWVIAACGVVGVVLALVVVPASSTDYTASQTLLSVGAASGGGQTTGIPSLDQMAILVTRGEVPRMVSAELKTPLADLPTVTATADAVGGTLTIEATGANPNQTAAVADAYAKQLIASIDGKARTEWEDAVKKQQQRVADVQAQIAAAPPTPLGDAQRATLQDSLSTESQSLSGLQGAGPATSGLQSVESAVAVASGSGTSRAMRALIAGAVGLLIGTGLALLLTRFDTRLHSREAAEEAFGFPVIAEIPFMSRRAAPQGPGDRARRPRLPAVGGVPEPPVHAPARAPQPAVRR